MYLAQGTRPNIAFAVSFLSRFIDNHGKAHFTAVKRVMRYVRRTKDYKLKYQRNNEEMMGFSDSYWAGDKIDYKFTAGWVCVYH